MFQKKVAFTRLPTDKDGQTLKESVKISPRPSSTKRLYVFGCSTIVLLTLLALVFSSTSRLRQSSAKWPSCGDSVETAKERGCSFDLISFAWQTPECYDAELVADFASWEGNWTFYADDQFTIPVGQELAIQGETTPLFVSWDYHIVHCTFMWRQMHRAYERGWIDTHLGNYNHTLHCQHMMLMTAEASAKKVTAARIIYPECTKAGAGQKQVYLPEYS
ncbi:hypothetical protein F5Y16DRAFT_401680 [Xylariaceae sp. FL0255]|nr:hypothetical protein F5Y16DRAFT_401680 [Xylariaceae sp. FL0255]